MGTPTPRITDRPTHQGWGEYQKKQARPVIVDWVRYRSKRQAYLLSGVPYTTVNARLKAGHPGYFELYGCACTMEALKIHGRCTCHDERN